MARFGLQLLEQPLTHLGGREIWRELRARLPSQTIPLFADESFQQESDLRDLAGLVQGVNIKLLKSGGYSEALACLARARLLGLDVMLGCMIESSIGVTAAAHLAGSVDWIDLDGHMYLEADDFKGLGYDGQGGLQMPQGHGLGVAECTTFSF
jgi:L-alanine-DL-glutamate epimerase-like enolase superfamily enzyme